MHTYAGRSLSTGQVPLATVALSDCEAQVYTDCTGKPACRGAGCRRNHDHCLDS